MDIVLTKSFIETQFPISKLSKESYKERKAGSGQTLTGLGKWWGRKPLVLVRACIIGLLMPASDNPHKDREIFFKIMTMDREGLWKRRKVALSPSTIYNKLATYEQEEYFQKDENNKIEWKNGLDYSEKQFAMRLAFDRMYYDEKLTYCLRPEEIDGPDKEAWNEINSHLGTNANSIQELVKELGIKRFGHIPKVGDCFCGGGSVPFEAARLGCEVFASDLNPVAALLTWASINIIGGGEEIQRDIRDAQEEAYKKADEQINRWGIEHNEKAWRADAYLYCVETRSPSSGYMIPLAPSWVISEKYRVVAVLEPDHKNKRFDIKIITDADKKIYEQAKKGTVQNSRLVDPITNEAIDISTIRGDKKGKNNETIYGLRMWENDDIVPRPNDVFQERLYCIRYIEHKEGFNRYGEPTLIKIKHYVAPDENDLEREERVLELLKKRFHTWQEKGYIPSMKIDPDGVKTQEPIRNRGWTHWHHLFNPRQLLVHGLLIFSLKDLYYFYPSIARLINWNSKLIQWLSLRPGEGSSQSFANQALNTLYNYPVRALLSLDSVWYGSNPIIKIFSKSHIKTNDARQNKFFSDIWLTDPPYADAINYHELADFFLAWYEKHLPKLFPDWHTDSKKALAVKGSGVDFKRSMVEIYSNLKNNMPDNGMQIVMFTHQDAGVWADLAMILWAAGLKVTAAWTIGTETSSGLKQGNYVQGTVLMVLRKRTDHKRAYLDEIYVEIENEVKNQLQTLIEIDDMEDPNFGDTDYQLAAYTSAIRILTKYSDIDGRDIKNELLRERTRDEKTEFEKLIDKAVEIACNYLIPEDFDGEIRKKLNSLERFYLKGIEFEMHKEARTGAYQELAKGFGIREYKKLFAKTTANMAKLKTPIEFKKSMLSDSDFDRTLLRQILMAVFITFTDETPKSGLDYIKNEIKDYWGQRKLIQEILQFIMRTKHFVHLTHWRPCADSAELLNGLIENDRG